MLFLYTFATGIGKTMDEDFESQEVESAESIEEIADSLNAERIAAWRKVLLAIGSCAIVALVFVVTKTWIWTGGLLLAGSWVFRSVRLLRAANNELVEFENSTGTAFKASLPTWMKVSIALAIPGTVILGLQAVTVYDPSILGLPNSAVAADPDVNKILLHTGDCLTLPTDVQYPTADFKYGTNCTSDHDYELYYQFDPTEKISSEAVGAEISEAVCVDEFQNYVGVPASESELIYTYSYPYPGNGESDADGLISCFVGFDGAQITGGVL